MRAVTLLVLILMAYLLAVNPWSQLHNLPLPMHYVHLMMSPRLIFISDRFANFHCRVLLLMGLNDCHDIHCPRLINLSYGNKHMDLLVLQLDKVRLRDYQHGLFRLAPVDQLDHHMRIFDRLVHP